MDKSRLITRTLSITPHNYTLEGSMVWQEIREFHPGFRAQRIPYAVGLDEIPQSVIRPKYMKSLMINWFTNIAQFAYVLLNYSEGFPKRYLYTLGLIPSKDISFSDNEAKVVDTESLIITKNENLAYAQAIKFVKDLSNLTYLLTRSLDTELAADILEATSNAFSLANENPGKHKIIASLAPGQKPYLQFDVI